MNNKFLIFKHSTGDNKIDSHSPMRLNAFREEMRKKTAIIIKYFDGKNFSIVDFKQAEVLFNVM